MSEEEKYEKVIEFFDRQLRDEYQKYVWENTMTYKEWLEEQDFDDLYKEYEEEMEGKQNE